MHTIVYHIKGGLVIKRHDYIRNILRQYCSKAGYTTTIEQKYSDKFGGNKRPGDICLLNFNGGSLYLDISVINVYNKSYVSLALKKGSKALQQKVREKIKKYKLVYDEIKQDNNIIIIITTIII